MNTHATTKYIISDIIIAVCNYLSRRKTQNQLSIDVI